MYSRPKHWYHTSIASSVGAFLGCLVTAILVLREPSESNGAVAFWALAMGALIGGLIMGYLFSGDTEWREDK